VVAHGLNQIYPKTHKKYVIKWKKTVVLWPSSGALRIRIKKILYVETASWLEWVIVIESADRGGSLITANMANDYNRDVLRFQVE
jgi:DNA processing protein